MNPDVKKPDDRRWCPLCGLFGDHTSGGCNAAHEARVRWHVANSGASELAVRIAVALAERGNDSAYGWEAANARRIDAVLHNYHRVPEYARQLALAAAEVAKWKSVAIQLHSVLGCRRQEIRLIAAENAFQKLCRELRGE